MILFILLYNIMGNSLSSTLGYFIVFLMNLKDNIEGYFAKKEKNYFSSDILLSDTDEHKAGKTFY